METWVWTSRTVWSGKFSFVQASTKYIGEGSIIIAGPTLETSMWKHINTDCNLMCKLPRNHGNQTGDLIQIENRLDEAVIQLKPIQKQPTSVSYFWEALCDKLYLDNMGVLFWEWWFLHCLKQMFWFVWFQTTINNLWSSVSRSDDHVGGSCPNETSNVPWVLTCCHQHWLLNTMLVSLAAQCELVQYLFNLMRQKFGGLHTYTAFLGFFCKCVRTHGRLLALFK